MMQTNFRKIIVCSVLVMLLQGLFKTMHSQTVIVNDSPFVKGSTVVIPGKEYKRSGYHNFFWGYHYRNEWATPVRVKNFFLDTAKGGLTPVKEGGGRQSRSLRLKDPSGKEYVLRSVNKDFGRGLKDMEGTFISRIAKDQVSIGHPYAAITITPMAKAIGIYHTLPEIVFVPKQPALKEYSEQYGDQLYLIESRPDENQEDADNFGNSKNVIGSEKLFEKILEDHDNHVNQIAFVRARLFDMIIGDWGRHPDNWRWAEFDEGKVTTYIPVPRDRDQAYTKIDGLYPNLAGTFLRQIQGFDYSLNSTGGFNYPGRPLDKKFLNELVLEDWIAQAKDIQTILTDSLVENSIRLMPPELFNINGQKIVDKLKARRDELQDIAGKYYAYLAKKVSVLGSDDQEKIQVNILPEKKVSIEVFKISKEDIIADTPYYSRNFNTGETKQLFIYGLGKKDIIEVKGEKKSKISIHIIDPQDKDSIIVLQKNSKIRGVRFYNGEKFEYDTLRDKKIKISIIPIFTPSSYAAFENDPLNLFPETGIKISAGIVVTPQPWRKKEYNIVHSVNALYGFLRTSLNIGYVGRFGRAAGKADLLLKARVDDPAVENYFGAGNNTILENKKRNYYQTFSKRVYGSIGFERKFENLHHAELSLIYQSVEYKKTGGHFISNGSHIDPSVFSPKKFGGLEAGYTYDRTNGNICPGSGFIFKFGGGVLKNLADTGSAFVKLNSSAALYVPLSRQFTLAMRAGGGTLFGEADFYHLNRLGGNIEIRGYDRERFYGKSVFYTNTELRWLVNTHNYFFNGRAGLVGFYDIGRVWMPDEKSNLWHAGYGMGLVIIPFNKVTLSAMYGLSKEGDNLFFRAEMFF
ncbi:MAG: BamA/TamA family outer membrane protein [Chitinophagaceae bacterium]